MDHWVTPAIAAGIPAAGAIIAAGLAARSAARTKAAELRATRTLTSEHRRAEVFEGLAEAIEEVWQLISRDKVNTKDFEKGPMPAIRRFMHWVQIYGSDESVQAASQYMQAIYHGVPPIISMRQMSELIIVTRRELGLEGTGLRPIDVMSFWINDVYDDPQVLADVTDPIEQVYARHGWVPPWEIGASRS